MVDRLAIVILNYNGRKYLETFLPSVLAHSVGYRVYVADNGSTDDSRAFVRAAFPDVALLEMPHNLGFAAGYNEALRHVRAEYYCLLNSDVEVTPGWIEPILSLFDEQPSVAACQPKVLSYHHRQSFEYAGPVGGFIDYLGFPFNRGRIFNTTETDTGQYDDTVPCFWACGACLFVRASVFWEMEGFDGDFFAHMEEIDLCWRLKNAGYEVYACGESSIYHVGGGTLRYETFRKAFLNFRNGLAMLYKNHPRQDLWLNLTKRLLFDGVAGAKFLAEGWPIGCWAVIRAHFNFYCHFRSWHRKRKHLLATRKSVTHPEVYPQSIVLQYFIRGKRTFHALRWKPESWLTRLPSDPAWRKPETNYRD